MSRQLICSGLVLILGTFSLAASLCVADDKKEPAKDELQQLEGTWAPVSSEMNGHKVLVKDFPAEAPRITIVFQDGKGTYVAVKPGGQGNAAPEMPVVVDATQTPKTLDVSMTMKLPTGPKMFPVIKGIYELQGDTLTICYPNPMAARGVPMSGLPRPKEIKANVKTIVLTFQRQKP